MTPKNLTKQIRKDPYNARTLVVQEVIDRLARYEGTYLNALIQLNHNQFPVEEIPERLGQRISPSRGIISAYETTEDDI